MLEDQAMIEMLDLQMSISASQYQPRNLPAYINKLLDLDFSLSGWILLYPKVDYDFLIGGVVFEREFKGKTEFKFLYPNPVKDTWLQLENKGKIISLFAKSSTENGFNNLPKWALIFKYELKPALEKGWKITFQASSINTKPESIYYRVLQ